MRKFVIMYVHAPLQELKRAAHSISESCNVPIESRSRNLKKKKNFHSWYYS